MSLLLCPHKARPLLTIASRSASSLSAKTPLPRLFSTSPLTTLLRPDVSLRRSSQTDIKGRLSGPSTSYGQFCRRAIFSSSKIICDYEQLPAEYRDQTGLPFRARELSDAEVRRLFGAEIDAASANQLLRILHGRRVAGTLDDPSFAVHTAQYTDSQITRALDFLRHTTAVNEIVNAGLRAEDELDQLEKESKSQTSETAATAEEGSDKSEDVKADPIYGRSALAEIRARNVARRKQREEEEEAERLAREEKGIVSGPLVRSEPKNPKILAYYKEAESGLKEPPKMKAWERILPSATLVTLVLGFLTAVTVVYEEPAGHYRIFSDVKTSTATIGMLIGANLLMYMAWKVPPLWKMLNKYAVLVVGDVKPLSVFISAFSHQQFHHVVTNMLTVAFVGSALHNEIGRAEFLTLYTACGSLGFLGTLSWYTLRGNLTVSSLGASGAALGVTSAFLWEHRNDAFRILGWPEGGINGIVFLAGVAALQLGWLATSMRHKLDLASHLVGMAVGVLGIEIINKGKADARGVAKVMDVLPEKETPSGTKGRPGLRVEVTEAPR